MVGAGLLYTTLPNLHHSLTYFESTEVPWLHAAFG